MPHIAASYDEAIEVLDMVIQRDLSLRICIRVPDAGVAHLIDPQAFQ
jgi:hypothetical protein